MHTIKQQMSCPLNKVDAQTGISLMIISQAQAGIMLAHTMKSFARDL